MALPPAPSSVVDSIVSVLRTKLGAEVVHVSAHDGDFDFWDNGDGKVAKTFPTPCVLVCCLGFPVVPLDFGNPIGDATFVAVCMARTPKKGEAQDTPGDVAMDLAGLVGGIVEGEKWQGKATQRATKIRPRNENGLKTRLKGVSVWTVAWNQVIELQTAVTEATYNDLRKIHFKFAMGDANTPDVEAQRNDLQGAP